MNLDLSQLHRTQEDYDHFLLATARMIDRLMTAQGEEFIGQPDVFDTEALCEQIADANTVFILAHTHYRCGEGEYWEEGDKLPYVLARRALYAEVTDCMEHRKEELA